MRSSVYEQFATVKEESASLFDAKLNEKVRELKDHDPKVIFSDSIPFYARISYTVNNKIPETISDVFEMDGVNFVCGQCPNFKPVTRDDGEVDKRCKWGDCEFGYLGRTAKDSAACDKLYEMIRERSVKLCRIED